MRELPLYVLLRVTRWGRGAARGMVEKRSRFQRAWAVCRDNTAPSHWRSQNVVQVASSQRKQPHTRVCYPCLCRYTCLWLVDNAILYKVGFFFFPFNKCFMLSEQAWVCHKPPCGCEDSAFTCLSVYSLDKLPSRWRGVGHGLSWCVVFCILGIKFIKQFDILWAKLAFLMPNDGVKASSRDTDPPSRVLFLLVGKGYRREWGRSPVTPLFILLHLVLLIFLCPVLSSPLYYKNGGMYVWMWIQLYTWLCKCILKYSINFSRYLCSQFLGQSSNVMVASLIMHFNMLKIAYLEKNLEKFSYLVLSGPPVREWY